MTYNNLYPKYRILYIFFFLFQRLSERRPFILNTCTFLFCFLGLLHDGDPRPSMFDTSHNFRYFFLLALSEHFSDHIYISYFYFIVL